MKAGFIRLKYPSNPAMHNKSKERLKIFVSEKAVFCSSLIAAESGIDSCSVLCLCSVNVVITAYGSDLPALNKGWKLHTSQINEPLSLLNPITTLLLGSPVCSATITGLASDVKGKPS